MPAYFVYLDTRKSGQTLVLGANAMVVYAENLSQAKEICSAMVGRSREAWITGSSGREIIADSEWNGWSFRINIQGGLGAGSDEPGTVSWQASRDQTIDDIGGHLVGELNELTGITGAEYDSASNLLTVAKGGGVDDLGDQFIEVFMAPYGGHTPISSLVGTISEGGAATDDLSVVLPADDAVRPIVLTPLKQV